VPYFYLILIVIAAYLIGSFSTAVWLGKIFFNTDVRQSGSKSAGATNTIRVLGLKAGLLVLFVDALKGWLAIYVARSFDIDMNEQWHALFMVVVSIAVVIGHVFPVFTSFKGGKGVATLMGVALALFPYELLILLGIFLVVFLISRYVSLASMTAAVCFPFISYFIFNTHELAYIAFAIFVALFVPITHIKNIKRLIKGEEMKMSLRKK